MRNNWQRIIHSPKPPFSSGRAFPRLVFIEHCYAGDDTNWWVPNRACIKAMLRSAGFIIEANPEEEVYVCRATNPPTGFGAVYPAGEPTMTSNEVRG